MDATNAKPHTLTLRSIGNLGKGYRSPRMTVTVDSWGEASQALRKWIAAEDLCPVHMHKDAGLVRDAAGTVLGRVSYNGRCWAVDGAEIAL